MNPDTPVRFTTNIDCCKVFMNTISGLPISKINPIIGDRVRVYKDSGLEIYLKVVGRVWKMTNGSNPVLECELHLENGWTIPQLEKAIRS